MRKTSRMDTCRACKSDRMYCFLELGSQPPANQFLAREQLSDSEPSFPLNAYVCFDCALIQVADQIPSDFFRHYVYMPSVSPALHAHFAALAATLERRFAGAAAGRVVDIGCNDGLLLGFCAECGLATLGIEPAANLVEVARGRGLEVVNEYFSPGLAHAVRERYGPAGVIVTTNTLNHIDDLHAFVEGVTILLDPSGVLVIEAPHAVDLVVGNEFDTIYHEHLSEFSVKSLDDLLRFFSMEIFDIERLEIHGGSMRVYAQKTSAGRNVSPTVAAWRSRELEAKLFSLETYEAFRDRVRRIKDELLALLRDLKRQGKRLAGYGAPAKGNCLLNYYGIGPELLDFLADKNTLKQGLYSPGMHIPVVSPETILEAEPDYLLVLAWNFADEILAEQAEYRRRGGSFILPIPEPRIVGPS